MTPLERYIAGGDVQWSEFKTYESRLELFREVYYGTPPSHRVDLEYVGWVDSMNMRYYPDGMFSRR